MVRIIIVGYMGSGKTTFGKALSDSLGIPFYDLDWYIQTRMHKSISQLFAEYGEEGFRKIEHNMLHEVAEFENVIISCGGGTPCFYDNMDYMNQQGDTVYLRTTAEALHSHLIKARVERPLLTGKSPDEIKEFVRKQLAEREPSYNKAKHIIDMSPLDTLQKIKGHVTEFRKALNI